MTTRNPEGQSDFLNAIALQKLIVTAMKSAADREHQELAVLLRQISYRHDTASPYVRSEVAELMQELKNLVGEFETSISTAQPTSSVPVRSGSTARFIAFAFAGCATVLTSGAISVEMFRQSNAIMPSQPASFSREPEAKPTICSEVNPNQITVPAHTRSDGVQVKAHQRTLPNETTADNIGCPR